jgi:hypothetical protein
MAGTLHYNGRAIIVQCDLHFLTTLGIFVRRLSNLEERDSSTGPLQGRVYECLLWTNKSDAKQHECTSEQDLWRENRSFVEVVNTFCVAVSPQKMHCIYISTICESHSHSAVSGAIIVLFFF